MASLIHFTSLFHSQPACGWVLQEVEVVGERIWVLGGEGFGTERARQAQGGPSAERARLAQGKNLQKFYLRRIRYFWVQNSKNPDPRKEFFFLGVNPPTC